MQPFGTIQSCAVLRDHTGRSKQVGFVQFSNAEEVEACIQEMHGKVTPLFRNSALRLYASSFEQFLLVKARIVMDIFLQEGLIKCTHSHCLNSDRERHCQLNLMMRMLCGSSNLLPSSGIESCVAEGTAN